VTTPAFGFYDKPNAAFGQQMLDKLKSYTQVWESPEKGIENVLIKQTPMLSCVGSSLR
jgi:putative ATP-dependent endonuclease of OLD family